MRMMMQVTIPVEQGNRAFKDGTVRKVLQSTIQKLKAEAAYFSPMDGTRTAFIVFDMKDSSDLVPITEPLFQNLNAHVKVNPAMNTDDLMAGVEKFGKATPEAPGEAPLAPAKP
jgi:hypothetical protein